MQAWRVMQRDRRLHVVLAGASAASHVLEDFEVARQVGLWSCQRQCQLLGLLVLEALACTGPVDWTAPIEVTAACLPATDTPRSAAEMIVESVVDSIVPKSFFACLFACLVGFTVSQNRDLSR